MSSAAASRRVFGARRQEGVSSRPAPFSFARRGKGRSLGSNKNARAATTGDQRKKGGKGHNDGDAANGDSGSRSRFTIGHPALHLDDRALGDDALLFDATLQSARSR